jgi:chromosome segregation protein
MFLKSLVLRGFKSFPDKTALEFEPGITIVVGPNGSGKSNVCDAISWVLGEQGPRSLRGGKMEDVIFAGSRLRPALGMTEVSLTIDNSTGILPVEFTEVTVSRTLFRSGESEYSINGAACRLLDVQELLSDAGIGRQQHTIVGQGELDVILQADPNDLRGFIEEAAGVAKHRRRRERAMRRIAAAEQNLARLSDLLAEIRRQLRPLKEQADRARRYAALTQELGFIRMIQYGRELAEVRNHLGDQGEPGVPESLPEEELKLRELETRVSQAERRRTDLVAAAERARETAWALARAEERLGSLANLSSERERTLNAELAAAGPSSAGSRLEERERDRKEILALVGEAAEIEQAKLSSLSESQEAASAASQRVSEFDKAVASARAGHNDATAKAGVVKAEASALAPSLEAAREELAATKAQRRALDESERRTKERLAAARKEIETLESEEASASRDVELSAAEFERLETELRESKDRFREIERESYAWRARASVRAASETSAQRILSAGIKGVVGILADLVECPLEFRGALDAVAGPATGVLVVEDAAVMVEITSALEPEESIGVLVAGGAGVAADGFDRPLASDGIRRLIDVVRPRHPAVSRALAGVYLAPGVAEAALRAQSNLSAVFVTVGGSAASGRMVNRGPGDALARSVELEKKLSATRASTADLEDRMGAARTKYEAAQVQINQADARLAAAGERLAALDRELEGLGRELRGVQEVERQAAGAVARLEAALHDIKKELPDSESRVRSAEASVRGLEEEHSRVAAVLEAANAACEEARTDLARANERRRVLEDRLMTLDSSVHQVAGESGRPGRVEDLEGAAKRARVLAGAAFELGKAATAWAEEAEARYQLARHSLQEEEVAVSDLRDERQTLAEAIDGMRVRAREQDAERSEYRIRALILEDRLRQEHHADPDQVVSRFGHRWEVDADSRLSEMPEKLATEDGPGLARRHARLERELDGMGRTSPLAAQEFDALTERESFLSTQIADVRASRRDLLKVIASIDDRIRELFLHAFADVASNYEAIFTLLFPAGQGRLRLTEPGDPLESGVEIEARPGGKNLKRLSLLSGGERALAALAFLFAIFRARPSPFYVLDEVDAALDDVNLGRFSELLNGFRHTSQLLVVTHQRLTMEAADILYGVSILPDGASRVISRRMPHADRDGKLTTRSRAAVQNE